MVASYPFYFERTIIQINTYRVPVIQLPDSFTGFRIIHLSDLHLGPLVTESFIESIVAKANGLKPDIIACTGDYVQDRNSTDKINRVWPILSKLKAPHGVYSVLGNHDHWADTDRSLYWLERSRQKIRHTCKIITQNNERLVIGGSGDLWEDSLSIDKAFAASDESDCRILLTHNPDAIDTQFKTPVSLVLSGHTHGGQVSVPFYGPPILPVKNKTYTSGLIPAKKAPIFISKGIGWTILPVRFNCYPEIAVLELFSL